VEKSIRDKFHRFSHKAADAVGSPAAFIAGLAVIAVWVVTGPVFRYSDTWQLVINTGTTIITFLMVFIIQNTQNRDSRAIHLKLDELIRSGRRARNEMVGLENLSDEDLDALQNEFTQLREQAEHKLHSIQEQRLRRTAHATPAAKGKSNSNDNPGPADSKRS
jgi:low affinity Fe/Cu permease